MQRTKFTPRGALQVNRSGLILQCSKMRGARCGTVPRPGGNVTGFSSYEFSISAKWLELLKDIAPDLKRVAVIRDASVPAGSGGFAAIQTGAASFNIELTPVGVHDADEIERGISRFATGPNGGLVVVGPPSSLVIHRDLIITLAARYRLPAVYT